MRLFSRFALAAMVLISLAGCDSGDPVPTTPVVNGTYEGTANVGGLAVTVTMTLTEASQQVNGSGTIRGTDVISVTASGTHVNPVFNLTLRSTGFEDLNYAGTVQDGGNVISGRLNGSGFDNVSVTLNRINALTGPRETEEAIAKAASAHSGDALMLDSLR